MPAQLYLVKDPVPSPDQAHQAQILAVIFAQECGFRVLPWMARKFKEYLSQGFDMDMITEVIQRTAMAPRPSWAYLDAIMHRASIHRCYTLDSFLIMPRKEDSIEEQVAEDLIAEAKNYLQRLRE